MGWDRWDPIGLRPVLEEGNDSVADEYDSYLLQAAGRLWNGASRESVADYLVGIEAEHMGLGETATTRARAAAVVDAIGDYMDELRARH